MNYFMYSKVSIPYHLVILPQLYLCSLLTNLYLVLYHQILAIFRNIIINNIKINIIYLLYIFLKEILTKDLFIARLTSSDPLPYICWNKAYKAASPIGFSSASCFSISFSTLSQSRCFFPFPIFCDWFPACKIS